MCNRVRCVMESSTFLTITFTIATWALLLVINLTFKNKTKLKRGVLRRIIAIKRVINQTTVEICV